MSSDIVTRCCICGADFTPGVLDKNGKCPICRVEYPTVKNKKEAMALNKPEINLGAKLDEDRVRQIVKEELNAVKAERKAEALEKARKAKEEKSKGGK